jgi:hypothetical protein
MEYLYLLMVVWVVLQVFWPANTSASWWSSCGQGRLWYYACYYCLSYVSSCYVIIVWMGTEQFVHCSARNVHVRGLIKFSNAILFLPCKATAVRPHMTSGDAAWLLIMKIRNLLWCWISAPHWSNWGNTIASIKIIGVSGRNSKPRDSRMWSNSKTNLHFDIRN